MRLDGPQITDETLRILREVGLLHALGSAGADPEPATQIGGAANNWPEQALMAAGPLPANHVKAGPPAGVEDVRSLNLRGSKVTDIGLRQLAGFKNLERLDLSLTAVTGASFSDLAGLAGLKILQLDDTAVTDDGLKGLARLKRLEHLSLMRTHVSDAGLKQLAGLEQLRDLRAIGTPVTQAGMREFAGLKPVHEIKQDQLLITAPGAPSGYQIFVVNADGSGRGQLTFEATGAFDAARSSDGKRIAFVAGRSLCLVAVDGTARRLITDVGDMTSIHFGPTWSPDGKSVAFSVRSMTGRGAVVSQVFVVDADGQNPRQLGRDGDLLATWSPNGKRLLFNRTSDPGGLCVMDAGGANVRIVAERALAGAYSPDGQSVAYVGFEDDAPHLYVSLADGSNARRIGDPAEAVIGPAQWSADGKRLLYTRKTKEDGAAVWMVDIDGRNARRLTTGKAPEYLGVSFVFSRLSNP